MSRERAFSEACKSFTCIDLQSEKSWHGITAPIAILNRRERNGQAAASQQEREGNGTGGAKALPVPFCVSDLQKKEGAVGVQLADHRRPVGCAGQRVLRAAAEILAPQGRPAAVAKTAVKGEIVPSAPRASGCSRFVRRRVAARLPEICDALIARAVDGDMQAVKLLWQMGELDEPTAKPARGTGAKAAVGFARKALEEFRAR